MNILTWLITLFIAVTPWFAINLYRRYFSKQKFNAFLPAGKVLIAAAVLYPIARFLPEPHLFEDTRTFLQHLIGGGFVSFLYFLYCKKVLGWKISFAVEIVVIYAFASSLGAANELLEFAARSIGLYDLDGSDVWYDLLANTLGAFVAYGIYLVYKIVSEPKK